MPIIIAMKITIWAIVVTSCLTMPGQSSEEESTVYTWKQEREIEERHEKEFDDMSLELSPDSFSPSLLSDARIISSLTAFQASPQPPLTQQHYTPYTLVLHSNQRGGVLAVVKLDVYQELRVENNSTKN